MKLYEHIILSKSGQQLHSTGWCERHWFSRGSALYNADIGPKRVKIHELADKDAENSCEECEHWKGMLVTGPDVRD